MIYRFDSKNPLLRRKKKTHYSEVSLWLASTIRKLIDNFLMKFELNVFRM